MNINRRIDDDVHMHQGRFFRNSLFLRVNTDDRVALLRLLHGDGLYMRTVLLCRVACTWALDKKLRL